MEEFFHAMSTLGYGVFGFCLIMAFKRARSAPTPSNSHPLTPNSTPDYMHIRSLGFKIAIVWTAYSVFVGMLMSESTVMEKIKKYLLTIFLLIYFKVSERVHEHFHPSISKLSEDEGLIELQEKNSLIRRLFDEDVISHKAAPKHSLFQCPTPTHRGDYLRSHNDSILTPEFAPEHANPSRHSLNNANINLRTFSDKKNHFKTASASFPDQN